MNNYGSAFSELRKKKNYTQSQVAEGILSRQQLSKFEKNLHTINIVSFFELLDRLNVTNNELLITINEPKSFHQSTFNYQIGLAILYKDVQKLMTLKSSETDWYQKDQNIRHQHNIILIDQYCLKFNNQPFDESLTQVITDYLFECEEWSYYELCLYNNCLEFLPIPFIKSTIKIASARSKKYIQLQQNKHIQAILFLNIVLVLLQNQALDAAYQMISSTKEILANSTLFFEINRLTHLEGIYHIIRGNINVGKQKCLQAIKALEYFGNQAHLQNHQNELTEFFGKNFTLE